MLERNSLRGEFYTGRFQNDSPQTIFQRNRKTADKPSKKNDTNQNKMNSESKDSIFESIAINLIAKHYGWNESSLAELHESQEDTLEEMRRDYPQSGSTEY